LFGLAGALAAGSEDAENVKDLQLGPFSDSEFYASNNANEVENITKSL